MIFQHLPVSPGVRASNSDGASIANNRIVATADRTPAGPVVTHLPAAATELVLGVPTLNAGGVYLNERTRFTAQTVRSNRLASFGDGLRLGAVKAGVTLDSAVLDGNRVDGPSSGARGIVLGPPAATPAPFVAALEVATNLFGCGFPATPPATLPPNAFIVPAGQTSSGNVGSRIPCGAP